MWWTLGEESYTLYHCLLKHNWLHTDSKNFCLVFVFLLFFFWFSAAVLSVSSIQRCLGLIQNISLASFSYLNKCFECSARQSCCILQSVLYCEIQTNQRNTVTVVFSDACMCFFCLSCPAVPLYDSAGVRSRVCSCSCHPVSLSVARLSPRSAPPLFFSPKATFDLAGRQPAQELPEFSDSSSTRLTRDILRTTASYVWAYSHSHMGLPRTLPSLTFSFSGTFILHSCVSSGFWSAQPLLRFCGVLSSFSYFLSHSSHLTKLLITAADMSHRVI